MNVKIPAPPKKLSPEREPKVEHITKSFRLPADVLENLSIWVNECNRDEAKLSPLTVNDLARQILEWGIKHRSRKK